MYLQLFLTIKNLNHLIVILQLPIISTPMGLTNRQCPKPGPKENNTKYNWPSPEDSCSGWQCPSCLAQKKIIPYYRPRTDARKVVTLVQTHEHTLIILPKKILAGFQVLGSSACVSELSWVCGRVIHHVVGFK